MLASLLFPYDDDAGSLIDGWLAELEREVFAFPASEHDDQVDVLAYAAIVAGQGSKPKPGLEGLAGFGVRVSPNRPG
jgi:hypothetical protein